VPTAAVVSAFAVGVGLGVGVETEAFATTLQLPAMLPVKSPVDVIEPHEAAAEPPVTSALAVAVVATGVGAIIADVLKVTGRPFISSPFWS